jgi:N-acyl-D-aspartate/D-glutamate deacylase
MMAFDLVIKNGTVVDGSGAARYRADVGVKDGVIAEIGRIWAPAERIIDADGQIVAPGFIDGHTHMDAQVAWDPLGSCSCWHGVTSVVMGNCGFALAPCRPEAREWFAQCLEAVEDIPTVAMLAGIDWTWESFPDYLAAVDALPKGINYGAYIGHSALRMYAMGERALDKEANDEELEVMAAAVREALRAGAMGLSTSRATTHVRPDGGPVASRIATPSWSICARSRWTAAGRSCSARWPPARATTPIRGNISSTGWTSLCRPAAGCSARPRPARSARCSRSNPTCRSMCCRAGKKFAPCRSKSRRPGCATPKPGRR